MAFRNTLVAATAFLSAASAHMIMESPVPYSKDTIDNGPISASQFPCKAQNGFEVSQMNKMAVGEKQQLSFKGSAVHNGGTCQLSVALGTEPTADTPFKVIKTIEGGCPGKNGPETFDFEIPDSIPDGEHTFAWTWMPVSSGQPEYYMNCAPIEVTGGASDESAYSSLPDMLVANLKEKTDCTQVVNTVLQVPNPGEVVQNGDEATEHAPPTGNCGASGGAPPAKKSSTPAANEPTPAPSNTGGVFAPSASSAAPESTTLVTVTATPQPPAETPAETPVESGVETPVPTPSGTPVASGSPAQPTGGAPSNGGQACSENGAIICNGPTQFGLCNNGAVVFQDVAAGTTCVDGKISKRDSYYGRIVRPKF